MPRKKSPPALDIDRTLYRDPVERAPIFSPHPWEGHEIHKNPVHAQASRETITAMARKHTVEAVLTLVYHMRNAYDPEISIRAAELLLERGWGKTPQVVGLVGGESSEGKAKMSVEERRRLLMQTVEDAMGGQPPSRQVVTPFPVDALPSDAKPTGTSILD